MHFSVLTQAVWSILLLISALFKQILKHAIYNTLYQESTHEH